MSGFLENLKSQYAHDATVLAGIENGSVRGIPLTQGKITIVDAEDYEWLNQWRWQAQKDKNTFYAVRTILIGKKQRTALMMHRLLLGYCKRDGNIVDHINRNGLDNRRSNIRMATLSINSHNRKINKNNISGYRGVSRKKGKWHVNIGIGGGKKHVGYFDDIIIAAKEYDKAVIKYRGSNAVLNFPKEGNNV